jgi:hypothetical protein
MSHLATVSTLIDHRLRTAGMSIPGSERHGLRDSRDCRGGQETKFHA